MGNTHVLSSHTHKKCKSSFNQQLNIDITISNCNFIHLKQKSNFPNMVILDTKIITSEIVTKGDRMSSSSQHQSPNLKLLPNEFVPGEDDVYCGRGSECFNHVGNQRFRSLVSSKLDEYSNAFSKYEKSRIIDIVINTIRQKSPNGGFVKKDYTTGRYHEVGDFIAREKTSQSFRDALQNKSKNRKGDEAVSNRPSKVARVEENNSNMNAFQIDSNKRDLHFEYLKTRELEMELEGNLSMLDRLVKNSTPQRSGSDQTLSTIYSRNESYNDIGNYETANIRSNSQDTFQRMLSTNNDVFHHETTSQNNMDAPKINPFLFPILHDATMLSIRNNNSFNWKQDSMQNFNSEFVSDTKQNKISNINDAINVKDAISNIALQMEDINSKKEKSKSSLEDCVSELIAKGELNLNTTDRKELFRHQQQKQAVACDVLSNLNDNEEDSRTFELLFQFTESYTNMNDEFPYEPNQLPKHE